MDGRVEVEKWRIGMAVEDWDGRVEVEKWRERK